MKYFVILSVLFLFGYTTVEGRQHNIDSLKRELRQTNNDTSQMIIMGILADAYAEINADSCYFYASGMQTRAKKLALKMEEVVALNNMGYALVSLGNYPRSLQILLSAIDQAKQPSIEQNILSVYYAPTDDYTDRNTSSALQRKAVLSRANQFTGILYVNSGNYEKALTYFWEAIPQAQEVGNPKLLCITHIAQSRAFIFNKQYDSALLWLRHAYSYAEEADFHNYLGSILLNTGRVYQALGKQDSAFVYFKRALFESAEHDYIRGIVASNLLLADMFKHAGNTDSSLLYIKGGLTAAYRLNAPELFLRTYKALADYYQNAGNNDSTVKYQALIIGINDSLFNQKQIQQFQNIDFDAQQQQQEIEAAKKDYQNRLRMYLLLGGMTTVLVVAGLLFRSNSQKKKTNLLLQLQKQEIEYAMTNLKATQAQLIHAEKMASLGELTAGVAHEIQNPLNFVNNFSEVNKELLEELKLEMEKGNISEARSIANDVIDNHDKINIHGKKVDAIVKGMLQHSQIGSGQKELTGINAMAEEYLRLAFHGIKTKDAGFEVSTKTDFDPGVGMINVIPKDISKVLLNLYNNAFYSVYEKSKSVNGKYEPLVTVTTQMINESGHEQGYNEQSVIISVKDNGMGVEDKMKDKIFQPFFTTKPPGSGTGLGLSLSYEIIKAHGGEIKVDSSEGEGAEFTITLPVKSTV